MRRSTRRPVLLLGYVAFLLTIVSAARAAVPGSPPVPESPVATPEGPRFKAVLIAGDRHSPAFDHATQAMRDRLVTRRVAPADIQRLSAAPAVSERTGMRSSTLDHVIAAIQRMNPVPGEGCLIFATSHGAYEDGLFLAPSDNFLTPAALDAALLKGCGDAPTVAIISGCFSGTFAQQPMARPNRIIFTAAREDRPSFGCGAGFQYTVYDRCLLAAVDSASTWRAAYDLITTCVARREQAMHFQPSGPQAFFGEAVQSMPIPLALTKGN